VNIAQECRGTEIKMRLILALNYSCNKQQMNYSIIYTIICA